MPDEKSEAPVKAIREEKVVKWSPNVILDVRKLSAVFRLT